MPRGNLEGIYPRIVMLKQLITDVEGTQYGKAFRMLRQHKIDINLIYDVNPEKFMTNIAKFVSEVKQVDYMNLFINSLTDEDRGKELEFMRPHNDEDIIRNEHLEFMSSQINCIEVVGATGDKSKVNRICESLKEELWKYS